MIVTNRDKYPPMTVTGYIGQSKEQLTADLVHRRAMLDAPHPVTSETRCIGRDRYGLVYIDVEVWERETDVEAEA